MFFKAFLLFIIVQRLIELFIARRNETWMKLRGAIEVGKGHYKFIVLIHCLFFVSLILEITYFQKEVANNWIYLFIIFLCLQGLRFWSLFSLGRFWNTKIIILPNNELISKGPYKYVRHPNYIVVTLELLIIPLMFDAIITACLFTILNAIALSIRIPIEEKALMKAKVMKPRLREGL